VDVDRYTASAIYERPLGERGAWSSTLAVGRNVEEGRGRSALLAESTLGVGRNVLFGRAEWVQKTGHDLVLPAALEEDLFGVAQVTGGYVRELPEVKGWVPGVGGRASVSLVPSALEAAYGRRAPVGFAVWLNLRPAAMRMDGARGDHGMAPMRPGAPTDVHGTAPAHPMTMPHRDDHPG
jgi:hypothetical protein